MDHVFPVLGGGARMALLQAVCAVAEHGQVSVCSESGHETAAARIVRAVLRNTRSFSNIHGVAGFPRSLNSVYAAAVALFLDTGLKGRFHRALAMPEGFVLGVGLALTRDGCTLIASDSFNHALYVINASNGRLIRIIQGWGVGSMLFYYPFQVWVASDDHVFVAEWGNKRVHVLTPRFEFHAFIKTECRPAGVCADRDIVAVSETNAHRISVYGRQDGALRHRFGREGSGDGELKRPAQLCLLSHAQLIVCAELDNQRVSVFSVEGAFVRHVSWDGLIQPTGSLAASASDELFVGTKNGMVVFNAAGEQLQSIKLTDVCSIASHGCNIYMCSCYSRDVHVFA